MADRCDFYFRQMVQENELDLAFEQLENADRNLAADVGIFGIVGGAYPLPHDPVPNLTIDLTAPGRSYDRLGQRIYFGADQSVNCSVDYTGVPTDVSQTGNERWLGVFLKFDRLLSDPRTDGNSQQVYFRRDEHFQILVRQAAEAPIGSAQKVLLPEDEILVCDIRRTAGQTQIVEADIDLVRRQAFVFSTGSAVEIDPENWEYILPIVNTVQSAFDATDTVFGDHFNGAHPHKAEEVTFSPVGFINEAEDVQSAFVEFLADLSTTDPAHPGASRIGSKAMSGSPIGLPVGTVDSHIAALLSVINDHRTASTNIHPAAGINVADTPNRLYASQVEEALQEILQTYETEHYRLNEVNSGQHRTIRQPNLGTGRVLLFHSRGNGSNYSQLRIFADSSEVWFTVNADWNGSEWVKDAAGTSGGIRLERANIRFINHYSESGLTFSDWPNAWRIPMSSTTNSAMEVYGDIRETGHIGIRGTNQSTSGTTITAGGTVTFRNRFPSTPSSISFTLLDNSNWSGSPIVVQPDRDGFSYYAYQYLESDITGWWYGLYTAIA